jgi:hypothetical protein
VQHINIAGTTVEREDVDIEEVCDVACVRLRAASHFLAFLLRCVADGALRGDAWRRVLCAVVRARVRHWARFRT